MKKFTHLFLALTAILLLVLPGMASANTTTAPQWLNSAIASKVNLDTQYYVFGQNETGTKYSLLIVDKQTFDTSAAKDGNQAFRHDGQVLYSDHSPNIPAIVYQYDASGNLVKTYATYKIGSQFGINGGGGLNLPNLIQSNKDILNYNTNDIALAATN